jgi:hypothetical protein
VLVLAVIIVGEIRRRLTSSVVGEGIVVGCANVVPMILSIASGCESEVCAIVALKMSRAVTGVNMR